jgi:hypothetical protein
MAGYWPLLSHLCGLHPWDLPDLTSTELDSYVAFVNQQRQQASP